MKKTLLILTTVFAALASFATDNWPGVCENLEITYSMTSTSDDLRFEMKVFVKNIGTTDIEQYCDISQVYQTSTVNIDDDTYDPSCYPVLAPGETKELNFEVLRDDNTVPMYKLLFKIKDGKDNSGATYCEEIKELWFNAPMSVNEIDRTEMSYETSYYDLMGREVAQPNTEGFYIIEKLYEDSYKAVEKVYFTQGL